ncbi:hypothetical protein L1I30_02385 [Gillisia sp. M10.2A]|uniref:Lipoprotein n=1 Tax=Gillisia lutea TaxID=2909668 RepID=A0ABS9EC95_9FLAO|nr:hypothetical protein [Gillisia lutea]MCF4100505.1 hypothetical protein [Gillisia lutea]
MKRIFFILALALAFVACEETREKPVELVKQPTEADSIKSYQGNYIAVGEEAVFKGNQFVYQVKMDSLAKQLKRSMENYKLDNEYTLPISIKGKVTDNPSNTGFSEIIEIKEVLDVLAKKRPENIETKN